MFYFAVYKIRLIKGCTEVEIRVPKKMGHAVFCTGPCTRSVHHVIRTILFVSCQQLFAIK